MHMLGFAWSRERAMKFSGMAGQALAAAFVLATAAFVSAETRTDGAIVGQVIRENPAFDALVSPQAKIERLAGGFRWSEGPVWIDQGKYLLLSDVPANRIYRWSERDGLGVFLEPSGYAGAEKGIFREPGSNGLKRGPGNTILVADHGNRAIAQLDLATKSKTILAARYQGKRFNSPNDLVRGADGSIWFTDPPYGLEGMNASPHKELAFSGVYRLLPSGEIKLIDDRLTFPNGIVLSPDERTLYVAVSDPDGAVIMAYTLDPAGNVTNRKTFADMTALVKRGLPGLPDGMAVDSLGNLFATGPGGVHVFSPAGVELGRIDTGKAIANCAFGEDGRTLFLTSSDFLARVHTRTTGFRQGGE
jgi:gluconolactonase